MHIPIRCFTCGKLIAHKWEDFKKKVAAGDAPNKVLDKLGFKRYCCRRMMLSQVEVMDEVKNYKR